MSTAGRHNKPFYEQKLSKPSWRCPYVIGRCSKMVSTDSSPTKFPWTGRENLLTLVVTAINGGVRLSSIVRERPSCLVVIQKVSCKIIYPLHSNYCPLDHLTFWWIVSQQEKWRLGGEQNRIIVVSVCSATELDICGSGRVNAIRKCSITTTCTPWVQSVVSPENKSWFQSFRAMIVFSINAVLSCKAVLILFITNHSNVSNASIL